MPGTLVLALEPPANIRRELYRFRRTLVEAGAGLETLGWPDWAILGSLPEEAGPALREAAGREGRKARLGVRGELKALLEGLSGSFEVEAPSRSGEWVLLGLGPALGDLAKKAMAWRGGLLSQTSLSKPGEGGGGLPGLGGLILGPWKVVGPALGARSPEGPLRFHSAALVLVEVWRLAEATGPGSVPALAWREWLRAERSRPGGSSPRL